MTFKKLIHPTTNTPFLFINNQFAINHHSVFAHQIFHKLNVFGPNSSFQLSPNQPSFFIIRNPQAFLETLPQEFIDLHQLYLK
jgi:hypothetical protein